MLNSFFFAFVSLSTLSGICHLIHSHFFLCFKTAHHSVLKSQTEKKNKDVRRVTFNLLSLHQKQKEKIKKKTVRKWRQPSLPPLAIADDVLPISHLHIKPFQLFSIVQLVQLVCHEHLLVSDNFSYWLPDTTTACWQAFEGSAKTTGSHRWRTLPSVLDGSHSKRGKQRKFVFSNLSTYWSYLCTGRTLAYSKPLFKELPRQTSHSSIKDQSRHRDSWTVSQSSSRSECYKVVPLHCLILMTVFFSCWNFAKPFVKYASIYWQSNDKQVKHV